MNPSAERSVDSSRVPPCPLVMGTAALVTPRHSYPLLFSILSSNRKEVPSSSLDAPPLEGEDPRLRPLDEDLDTGLDADDEGDGEKDPGEGEDLNINAAEIEILQGIINPCAHEQVPSLPKSGEK